MSQTAAAPAANSPTGMSPVAPIFPEFQFSVIGTDINTEVLEAARAGEYHPHAVRHIPENIPHRYFDVDGSWHRICREVRAASPSS